MLINICYSYLLYTDFVSDIEMRYFIGWITIFANVIIIVVNLTLMVSSQFTTFKINRAKK